MPDRNQIEEIKSKLDIVEIAKTYLRSEFKHSGRNTFTLCPFHSEKSPSFSLNSDLGIYKCFGCGESGDIIKFIEKIEGVDFPQALEIAAQKAGITLKTVISPKDKERDELRKRILHANELAAGFYHYLFMTHESGKLAREYTSKRKLRKKELKLFSIGYAPKGYNNLKNYLSKKGFNLKELVNFGLLVEKNGRIYDKFRYRLVFPIKNLRGEIVGFSARTLEKDGIPKYLNTSETLVYKKSDILYGLYEGKDEIRKRNFVIIAEGNVEPLSSRKSDIPNIVVPMGTALTESQIKMLKRYTDNIYFAFDTDSAGFKALIRSVEIAYKFDFDVRAINLGKYKDPDEMITENPILWKNAVEDAVDIIDFLVNYFKSKFDINSAIGKKNFIKNIQPFIAHVIDPVEKEHYIKKISSITNTSQELLWDKFNKSIKKDSVPTEDEEPHENKILLSKELFLVALIFNYPQIDFNLDELRLSSFSNKLLDLFKENKDTKSIRAKLDNDEQKLFDTTIMTDFSKLTEQNDILKYFKKLKADLLLKQLNLEINRLNADIKTKEESGGDTQEELEQLTLLIQKKSQVLKK